MQAVHPPYTPCTYARAMSEPGNILETYDAVGPAWADGRTRLLFERPALARMRAAMPGPRVLDLGCGAGDPLALWFARNGCRVTGVDGAASMVALFRHTLPRHEGILADMRGLALGRRFDGILAWDSFFHLSPDDQRGMFATFAAHAAQGAALMFTSGPEAGERIGAVEGRPVYHASLAPEEYRRLLDKAGFEVLDYRAEDPELHGHTVWLAKRAG